MSFIDAFLDLTATFPREIVRLVKLIREVDERSAEYAKRLDEELKLSLAKQKLHSKHNTQYLTDLHNKIINDYKISMSLSSYKLQIINELNYLIYDLHIKEVDNIIEKGEKEVKDQQGGTLPLSIETKSLDDSISNLPTSKKKTDSTKPIKSINKMLGKKKNRSLSSTKTKKQKQINETNLPQPNHIFLSTPPTEHHGNNPNSSDQLFCFCKGPSYGNMIACDNNDCPIQWFHYDCVGITEKPHDNQHWFCSEECRLQATRKKKKKLINL